jgi:hypothetical protein
MMTRFGHRQGEELPRCSAAENQNLAIFDAGHRFISIDHSALDENVSVDLVPMSYRT